MCLRLFRSEIPRFLVIIFAIACMASGSRAFGSTFTPIDIDGATLTVANGLNPAGDIAGWYRNASGVHGFVLRNGDLTTIDVQLPNGQIAGNTQAKGINPEGDVVGWYSQFVPSTSRPGCSAVNPCHGFLLQNGVLTTFDIAGPAGTAADHNTMPVHISPEGAIVGCLHEGSNTMSSMHGWMKDGESVTVLGTGSTMNNGISPVGVIVGLNSTTHTAYALINGTEVDLHFPGSVWTDAWDVNASGEIVGAYRNSATGAFHGFVYHNGEFSSIDYPGAAQTQALGINSRGQVVGSWIDSAGRIRLFIL